MKRENRVLKHREFSQIISKSPFVKSTHFVIHYRKKDENHLRVGINVGKKNGGAVTRNKIKRQIRTLVDNEFKLSKPFDLIILVRPTYQTSHYEEARSELKMLWEKIGEEH